jgi:catechol 2,3-dioxygenase-like lactoylglutathione lyase family enzyme
MSAISAIPVFHVADVDAAVRFYVQLLGFAEAFRYGTYSGLKFGRCEIHVTLPGDFGRTVGGGTAYIICDEVDEYFARLKAAGVIPRNEIADRMYGMRDFVILDPDGNQLSFGCDLENAS